MTAVAALVADLQSRGVTLEPRGDRLRVRPVSRLLPDELELLRRHKAEVLALLAPAPVIPLDRAMVRKALGADPDEHALACLRFDVLAAVRQLEAEIMAGDMAPSPLLVRGRPLADWLDLDDVARLLRSGRDRSAR